MNTHKDKTCIDCNQIFSVRNQHVAIIKRCLLCQSKFDRLRRSEHQREVRKAKKNKISALSCSSSSAQVELK